MFQVLFILLLVFWSDGNYGYKHMQPLTILLYESYECTRLQIILSEFGDTWKTQHFTLVHQQYTGQIIKVVFMQLKLKQLLLYFIKKDIPVCFIQEKLTIIVFLPTMISIVSCRQICASNHVQVQLSMGVINGLMGSFSTQPVIHNNINS